MIPEKMLKNEEHIPVLGLGTWQLKGEECVEAVETALQVGYRHIDTAKIYGNQREIGEAIEDFNRDKLFITSKLWRTSLGYEDAIKECHETLEELGTDYVDLYLIHWPDRNMSMEETFSALEELHDAGKVKAVGVSNFTVDHVKEALRVSDVPIVMNQVEYHPFLNQEELLEFCRSKQIQVTAYSPIARGKVFESDVLNEIGEVHGKTAAQVSLKWLVQKGLIAVPKSGTPEHIRENFDIFDFELEPEEMERVDNIGKRERLIDPGFADFD